MMEYPGVPCHSPTHPMFAALLKTLRPKQWVKNGFVFLPLLFAHKLTDPESVQLSLAGFSLFCLISGCVYIINDIVDVEKDRQHPKKCKRPIPSGALPINVARAFAIVAAPSAIGVGLWLAPMYGVSLAAYFCLNLAYCFKLKQIPYLDVLSIASGFLLRVVGGAMVIAVPPSIWLLSCTVLLAMFLGFGKRAHELATAKDVTAQRPVLRHYNLQALTWLLHTLAVVTTVTYGVYTQSEHVRAAFPGVPFFYTIPFGVIGIMRFIYIVMTRTDAESPTEEMLRDLPFMLNVVAGLAVTVALIYGFI